MCGKENSRSLFVGLQSCGVTNETIEENSQKNKNKSTIYPSYTTSWDIHKGLKILVHRCLIIHVCCCSTHKNLKKSKYPKTNKWITKVWQINTLKYNSSLKSIIPNIANKWMKLEKFILSILKQILYTQLQISTCACIVHSNQKNQESKTKPL